MPALLRLVSRPTTAGHLATSIQAAVVAVATKGAVLRSPAIKSCSRRRPASSFVTPAVPRVAASTPLLPTTATTTLPDTQLLRHFHHSTRTMASATSFYDFKPLDKKGQPYDLASLKGKVILVVNTASKCGFTPQFGGLEALWKDVKAAHPDDFLILGFPCNQFGGQDPGSNDEIQSFCQVNYGVSFPVLGKVDVNGDSADPVWEWLKKEQPGLMGLKRVKWNFEKFLIGRDGKVKGRWASTTKPETLKETIEKELAAPKA